MEHWNTTAGAVSRRGHSRVESRGDLAVMLVNGSMLLRYVPGALYNGLFRAAWRVSVAAPDASKHLFHLLWLDACISRVLVHTCA